MTMLIAKFARCPMCFRIRTLGLHSGQFVASGLLQKYSSSSLRISYHWERRKHTYSKIISALYNANACTSQNQKIMQVSQHAQCQKYHINSPDSKEWQQPIGKDSGINVFNTLTKQKDPLILPHGKQISWYMCGPTVYDSSHIGHGISYLRFDIIRRVLDTVFNLDVTQVMPITDIDDKIIKRANETGQDFREITQHYEGEFFHDMASLNILPPTVVTRVTDHIPHIIDFTHTLIDKGFAYSTPSGSVYFDLEKYALYGQLHQSGAANEAMEPSDEEKRRPQDFALWKAAKPGEPWWSSPWGPGQGRPGWHIECSAMASSIFGSNLDMHTGGEDLIFPHHENELAQSQAYFGCTQWANYWLHTGHLHLKNDDSKMSKSLKNVILISDFLDNYTANEFRMFCLLTHYRNKIEYSDEKMEKAGSILKQILSVLQKSDAYVRGQLDCASLDEAEILQSLHTTREEVMNALADDFNTPAMMVSIMSLVHLVNSQLGRSQGVQGSRSPGCVAAVSVYIQKILRCVGLEIQHAGAVDLSSDMHHQLGQVLDSVVSFRTKVRQFALEDPKIDTAVEVSLKEKKKQKKQEMGPLLQACDEIRKDLALANIQIQDHGKKTSWQILERKSKIKEMDTENYNILKN